LQSFSGVAVPSLEGQGFTLEGETQAVRVAQRIARASGRIAGAHLGQQKDFVPRRAAMAAGHVLAVEKAATQLLVSLGMKRGEAIPRVVASVTPGAGEFRKTGATRRVERVRSLAEITK